MDWDLAIKRNSEALVEIVADLFAMLGFALTDTAARLPWPTYRAVLRILRPAESALRRLIVHRGARPCGGARAFAFQAGGANKTKEGLAPARLCLPAFRSAETHRDPAPAPQRRRGIPRASTFSPPIPAW